MFDIVSQYKEVNHMIEYRMSKANKTLQYQTPRDARNDIIGP